MREIKFRAWYKPLGEMIEPNRLEHINFEVEMLGVYLKMKGKGFHKLRMSDFVIMQYTGLKDKNGVEIYEGDVVGFIFRSLDLHKGTGVIKYNSRYGYFGINNGNWFRFDETTLKSVEVIGNVFDNPELLGEGTE